MKMPEPVNRLFPAGEMLQWILSLGDSNNNNNNNNIRDRGDLEKQLHSEYDVAVCGSAMDRNQVKSICIVRELARCVSNSSMDSLLEILGDLHNKHREQSSFGWSLCLPQLKRFRQYKGVNSDYEVATVYFSLIRDVGEQDIGKSIQSIKDYLFTKGWNNVLPIDGNLYPRSFNFSLTILKKQVVKKRLTTDKVNSQSVVRKSRTGGRKEAE